MRLIDADALRRRLIKQRDASAAKQNYGWEWEYNGWNGAILQIGCEMIEHPVDAVPVRHGKWKEYPTGDGLNQCSECGVLRFGESNYCPNCGARMDEE
jgi:hypothetical protein